MTLYDGAIKTSYQIEGMFVEKGIARRLEALGLNDGTFVTILNRKRKGAIIISVRGTRLALGKQITSLIEVKQS